MTDISIDLETLSTRFDSAILSIGAAQFDMEKGTIGQTFYREIDINSAIRTGHVSGDTLSWWARQDDKAKRIFGDKGKTSLPTALDEMIQWVRKLGKPRVWGNGSSFDITILERAITVECVGQSIPWSYWDIRDMRTIVDVAGLDKKQIAFNGTAHNALDDATHQAKVISMAWGILRKSGTVAKAAPKPTPAAPAEDDL